LTWKINIHQHQVGSAIHCCPDRGVRSVDGAHDLVSSIEQRVLTLMRDEMIVLDDENAPEESESWRRIAGARGFNLPGWLDQHRPFSPSQTPTRLGGTCFWHSQGHISSQCGDKTSRTNADPEEHDTILTTARAMVACERV